MEVVSILVVLFSVQFSKALSKDCPVNYSEYSGHCYDISSLKLTWTEARDACKREGGDLVAVNDKGEDDFLKGILSTRHSGQNYWIGLVNINRRFAWLDGTSVQNALHEVGRYDCMIDGGPCRAVYSAKRDYKWEQVDVNNQEHYICELDPSKMHVATTTVSSKTDLQAALHLECHQLGWYVTVDLDKLSRRPSDISEIYMNEDTCVGTLQGGLLVFNKTYQECNTRAQVVGNRVNFYNYLVYAIRDSNNVIRDLRWRDDLQCSHEHQATNIVNIKPAVTQQGSSMGQISGALTDIKLYTDSAFSQPLQGSVKLGTPVYVQVLSLSHPDVIMVVDSCQAEINTTSSQNQKPLPLIQHHCSVDSYTKILALRNQVTRFTFNMFDLPNDHDGINVICTVVFCDPMDFSSKCEQTCKTSSTLVG